MDPLDYLDAQHKYADDRMREYANARWHEGHPPVDVADRYLEEGRKAWALPREMLHEHTERNTYRHNARWLHTGEPDTQRIEYPYHA